MTRFTVITRTIIIKALCTYTLSSITYITHTIISSFTRLTVCLSSWRTSFTTPVARLANRISPIKIKSWHTYTRVTWNKSVLCWITRTWTLIYVRASTCQTTRMATCTVFNVIIIITRSARTISSLYYINYI